MTNETKLHEALKDALEWIDAVPADVVASLPAMPGFNRDKVDELIAAQSQPAATVQEVGREAFKAGWRTNAVGEETHPASYLDNCEQGDWEEYQRRGINAYLAALTAEPAAKARDADSDLFALAQRYKDTMGLTREGAIRRIGVLVDAILDATPATTTERGRG